MDLNTIIAIATALVSPLFGALAASSLTRYRIAQLENRLSALEAEAKALRESSEARLSRLTVESATLKNTLDMSMQRLNYLEGSSTRILSMDATSLEPESRDYGDSRKPPDLSGDD